MVEPFIADFICNIQKRASYPVHKTENLCYVFFSSSWVIHQMLKRPQPECLWIIQTIYSSILTELLDLYPTSWPSQRMSYGQLRLSHPSTISALPIFIILILILWSLIFFLAMVVHGEVSTIGYLAPRQLVSLVPDQPRHHLPFRYHTIFIITWANQSENTESSRGACRFFKCYCGLFFFVIIQHFVIKWQLRCVFS